MKNMPSDKVIQDTVDQIFKRPEFNVKETLMEKILRFLEKLLSKINFNPSSPSSWLSIVVISLVVLVALSTIIYFIAKAVVFLLDRKYYQKAKGRKVESTDMVDVNQALELSRIYCSQGLYSEAVRYMFLYLLLRLYELGHIRFSENRTNYQYIKELARNGYPKLDLMKSASSEYEKIVYGGVEINGAQYEEWRKKVEALTEGVEGQ